MHAEVHAIEVLMMVGHVVSSRKDRKDEESEILAILEPEVRSYFLSGIRSQAPRLRPRAASKPAGSEAAFPALSPAF